MSQYDELLQALLQSQGGFDESLTDLQPLQDRKRNYETRRMGGWLGALGETVFDAIQRKKYEPQYQDALTAAMGAARGVDQRQAELEAFLQEQEALSAQADEQATYFRDRGDEERDALRAHQYKLEQIGERNKGPGQTITQVPSAPQGYYYTDPNNPRAGLSPIPGGPAAQDLKEKEELGQQRDTTASAKYAGILDEANQAFDNINAITSGFIGASTGKVRGTQAYTLAKQLDTLKANLGFDRLTQMREESKTGGALGQVSNIELNLLTSSLTSLDTGLPPGQLRRNVDKVRTHYQNFIDALSGKMPQGYDAHGNPSGDGEPFKEGQTATGPNGEKIVYRNGQWGPL